MTLLNSSNLATIEKTVAVPTYDREQVRTGIVHIGVGGFTVPTRRCTSTG